MKKTFLSFTSILVIVTQSLSQTPKYEVYALKFASVANQIAMSVWAMDAPSKDSIKIDFMIWLIKGNNGKNILVDAGFQQDLEEAKGFGVSDYIRPDSMLLKLGLHPGDITDIILSHPHWDHIDGIDLFPNAHVWMQKEDYNYFVGAAWQTDSTHGGFVKRDVEKVIALNLYRKLTLVDGDNKEIIPGIKVFTGSRHTFNSEYALVETGTDKIIIASDNIWIYYNLEHMKSAPSYGTFDPIGYVASMRRMKTQVSNMKFIIPGHDPRIFSTFPTVTKGIVKIN